MTITDSIDLSGGSAAETGSDFVFTFSYESLTDARKRGMARPPDRLVSTLMTGSQVRRLLIADPYRSWTTNWAREIIDFRYRPRDTARIRHVSPMRRARADPTDVDEIRAAYAKYSDVVANAARRAGLRNPAFITANPVVAGFAKLEWTRSALYYARDDWLSSPARRQYWPVYREAYQRIADRGVAVAAVSQEIIDRIAPTGPHAVVPNGILPEEWLGTQPAAPDWFSRIPGPRAVYVGTLDSRLDADGLIALASARRDLQIVLIGPAADQSLVARLNAEPNIHVRGLVGRGEVVAVLRNADVTLLAHRRTPLTEAMSPLKVYEYLAAGRPVLATDLRPVRGLGSRVLLSETVTDFIDTLDEALELGVEPEPGRRAFIGANAWSSRHHSILALLDKES